MLRIALFIVVCNCTLVGGILNAAESVRGLFAWSMISGIQPGMLDVNLAFSSDDGDILPSIAYGFAVSYGQIEVLNDQVFTISAEINSIRAETSPRKTEINGDKFAQYRCQEVPVMIFGELSHVGKLGPFVKVGIGKTYITVIENNGRSENRSVSAKFWSFAYGFGAGIRYSPRKHLEVLFEMDGFVGTESGVGSYDNCVRIQTDAPFGFQLIGVRLRYWI